jgi:hypothetical protein
VSGAAPLGTFYSFPSWRFAAPRNPLSARMFVPAGPAIANTTELVFEAGGC